MIEHLALRCCKCNYEFEKDVETEEKIYELICSQCKKQATEINAGKKVIQQI